MPPNKDARTKLLDAAMDVIRGKGFAATSVDELCQAAGVTKGAFFHHFRSKEELGVAAAAHFGEMAAAHLRRRPLPVRSTTRCSASSATSTSAARSCRASSPNTPACSAPWCRRPTPPTRRSATACEREIIGHAATLEADHRRGAGARGAGRPTGRPRSLALHIQGVLQGAFILAKATGGAQVAADSLGHLRRYLTLLLRDRQRKGGSHMSYVDGFVVAVPTANREAYRKHAEEALAIFKEHGGAALRRVLGRRRARRQGHVLPDGGEAQGRRDGGLLLGRMALAGRRATPA